MLNDFISKTMADSRFAMNFFPYKIIVHASEISCFESDLEYKVEISSQRFQLLIFVLSISKNELCSNIEI